MGHKISKDDSEAEIAFIAKETGMSEETLRKLHQSFSSAKKRVSKKEFIHGFRQFYPKAVSPDAIAERVFKTCDVDNDRTISFREFALSIYMMTEAPKEEKLRHIFTILDLDGNGTLSSREVIQAVKHAYDILGDLNFDYNCKGIEIFRSMDANGDLKVNADEFVSACLKDEKLCQLLEESLDVSAVLNQMTH